MSRFEGCRKEGGRERERLVVVSHIKSLGAVRSHKPLLPPPVHCPVEMKRK
jgi:hypothetical protein